ncbi:mechanosensitive ion channel family protein [Psychromonas sp. B3M02]|uniref:mechanosensitive ion channel domain-containing protein n=1 Tax=Psychromonas sp. B3M02 TaxID=2267226 RepID=UPI000DEAA01E|nr:mechanosensitive ion channel domain-containing protein [Psychromonas sp. B3M02]RBW47213.1 mechanosensitive ion channel family protein [Psychromonas sp. B3M02]
MSSVDPVVSEKSNAILNMLMPLVEWIQQHQAIISHSIINLVVAILIIAVGLSVARLSTYLMNKTLIKKGVEQTLRDFVCLILRYALIAMSIIAGLAHVGVQTASLIALLGAASLAIGLALKGALSNFAAGILLIVLRPFKMGDFIEAAGTSGTVESIQVFNCILKAGDNRYIVVPNRSILKSNIVNVSRKPERRIDLVIRVDYKSDLKQVKALLEEVVLANEKVLSTPKLQIAVSELAASSVNLVVRPWVKSSDYWSVRFALIEAIKVALDEASINIPYAQLQLHCKA